MIDFLKTLLAVLVGLILMGLLVMAVVTNLLPEKEVPDVPDGAVLVIDLSIPIADKPKTVQIADIVQRAATGASLRTVTLHSVLAAINCAAKDDRISGIYLHGEIPSDGLHSGWAALEEIRDALVSFRRKGKKIYAFSEYYTEKEYFLATTADEIFIHAMGTVELNGFAAERIFYARAMEKFGLEVQVTRVGKYKSAVEPYIMEEMSPASREQTKQLLNDIFDAFLKKVTEARGLSRGKIEEIAANGGLVDAEEAVELGLADRSVHFDAVLAKLKALSGSGDDSGTFEQISMPRYMKAMDQDESEIKVAVIFAEGDIVDGECWSDAGGDTVAALLREARHDEAVKAVVLRVNSPGGSPTASDVILREVRLIAKEKPIVVSMGTVAASGGYWIASCATEIFAQPTTITGSIGVFGLFPSIEALMNELGLDVDRVKTSDHADIMAYTRRRTDKELDILQHWVDDTYEKFLDRVSEGRGLEREKVHEIAQGRVWSGRQGKEIGLVDALGGLRAAGARAAELARLDSDYELCFPQEEEGTLDDLLDYFSEEERLVRDDPLMQRIRSLSRELRGLARSGDSRGVHARLGWNPVLR